MAVSTLLLVLFVACSSEDPSDSPTPERSPVAELRPPTITAVSTVWDVGAVDIWWQYEPDEAVTIEFERANSPDGPWRWVGFRNSKTQPPPFHNSGLGFCGTFWFRAYAMKGDLRSEPSEVKSGFSGEPLPAPPPATPLPDDCRSPS